MNFNILLVILAMASFQGNSRVESLSITDVMLQKLRSIVTWLDSLNDATIFDYILRVNRGVGLNLFEGDIKDYNPKQPFLRTAIRDHRQLWNTRIVPYVIDPTFDSASRKDILAAIAEYHTKTCIKFVPRTTETDYIHFKQIDGCYSNVGRTGGEQDISLMGACLKKGTAIHEMMHALGFWHEQSRPDRDSWVHIIKSNIQSGKSYNFDKLSSDQVDTLGVQYDYGSIMHYSKYAFSMNGNPTIMPTRQTNAELGQREGLSEHDVLRIKTLYRCDTSAEVKTTPAVTQPPATVPPKTKPAPTTPQTHPTTVQPTTIQTHPTTIQPTIPQTHPTIVQPTAPKTHPTTVQPTTPQTHPTTVQPTTSKPTRPVTTTATTTTMKHTDATITTAKPSTHTAAVDSTEKVSVHTDAKVHTTTLPPPTTTAAASTQHTYPPVNQAGWTLWSVWSPCDLECRHSRYRFCLNYDENYCPGENSQVADCPAPCKPTVSLGCWKENKDNLSIPSVEGMSPALTGSYKGRSAAVRKCADYASIHGYTTFALVDGGKCLTGPYTYTQFTRNGASSDCSFNGTGSDEASNVYSFETDIDGQWSLWTGWSQCTKTCDLGRQYRYRRCDNPSPHGSGSMCPGYDQEVAICNLGTCIVPTQCGTKYHAGGPGSSGLIWVRDYNNFMECDYQIATGDPMATISVYIHELDIEYSKGCIYDSLMVHDGSSYRSPLVGAFCGNSRPGAFESTANYVYLKFESDETNTGRGFTVFYNINSRSKKACVRPPLSDHVSMKSEGNMVGDRAWYQCVPGYKMVGNSPITCTDQPGFALWDDLFPRCVHMRKRSTSEISDNRCTFEESLCGFKNEITSNFNWTVKRSEDAAANATKQFPEHETYGFSRGNYLTAECSRLQSSGDAARVSTKVYSVASREQCLQFIYRLDAGDKAFLNVYAVSTAVNVTQVDMETRKPKRATQLVWQTPGDDESDWHIANVDINMSHEFQIIFEAVLGDEIGSTASIDDVILNYGKCH